MIDPALDVARPAWPYRAPLVVEGLPVEGSVDDGNDSTPDANITFAVVIAAYNAGPYVAEAIESVLKQTRAPEKIIVVDDGSTDSTADEIARYADQIQIITQVNGGEGAAKNAGWRAATTDFVVFLDADDRFVAERIEAMHWLTTQRRDLDIVVTDLVEFGPQARDVQPMSRDFDVVDQRSAALDHCTIYVPAIRRELLIRVGGMRESREIHRDWELAVRLILAGGRCGVVARRLYEYRRWDGQTTADELRVVDMDLRTLDAIAALDQLNDVERASLARKALDLRVNQWRLARQNDVQPAAQVAARFVATNPEYPATLRLRARISLAAPRLTRKVVALRRRLAR